jgi:diaminopimelate epimerase
MKLHFYKYEGAGNDFIMIDNRTQGFEPEQSVIYSMCRRHFGIGADGLILLEDDEQNDFKMRYYNADGLEGSLCGNGGRCIALFAYHLKLTDKFAVFNASDGIHGAEIISAANDQAIVKLKMNDVSQIQDINGLSRVDTGSPHLVITSQDIDNLDVREMGRKYRYDKLYGLDGVNVNFMKIEGRHIYLRTYERGVENETLACGTGAVAAAIVAMAAGNLEAPAEILARGGTLQVFAKKQNGVFHDVWLQGPAARVFEGFTEIG